jgi:hypothetical protein
MVEKRKHETHDRRVDVKRRACLSISRMCTDKVRSDDVEYLAGLAFEQVLAHSSDRVRQSLREAWPRMESKSKRVFFFYVLNVGSWLRSAACIPENEETQFLDGLSVLCKRLSRRKIDKDTFLVDVERLYRATRTTWVPSSV